MIIIMKKVLWKCQESTYCHCCVSHELTVSTTRKFSGCHCTIHLIGTPSLLKRSVEKPFTEFCAQQQRSNSKAAFTPKARKEGRKEELVASHGGVLHGNRLPQRDKTRCPVKSYIFPTQASSVKTCRATKLSDFWKLSRDKT